MSLILKVKYMYNKALLNAVSFYIGSLLVAGLCILQTLFDNVNEIPWAGTINPAPS